MEQLFLPILIGFTSVSAFVVGTKTSRLSAGTLYKAVGKMLECVGLTITFGALNVMLGMLVALVTRLLASTFVSLYLAGDAVVLGLSLLQAITFQWWYELSKAPQ